MRTRRAAKAGLTLVEVIASIFLVLALAGLVLPWLARTREERARIPCRNNLNQLAKGMATYLNEYGDNQWFPCPLGRGLDPDDYSGAEWLASLYWTGVITNPGVFLCADSRDSNDDGRQFGVDRAVPGLFGSQTVSYAGMHYHSDPQEAGAIRDDYPPNKPMASDDTQGDINHTGRGGRDRGMSVLFFDSHVEFRTPEELDLEHAVGQEGGLLEELRN